MGKTTMVFYVYEIGEDDYDGGIYEMERLSAGSPMYLFPKELWTLKSRKEHAFIPLVVSGRTYAERKKDLREKAIEYSNAQSLVCLSCGEFAMLNSFFETNGKRYGLLEEFRENAIC